MKHTYSYPAVFHIGSARSIGIEFPDLPGCLPCGDNMEEALKNAHKAICLHLFGLMEDSEPIPEPTPIEAVKLSEHERVLLIEASLQEIQGQP